jgi:hypothetical protein
VTKLIKIELHRFDMERVEDFKRSLEAFLEGMIRRQKEVCRSLLLCIDDVYYVETPFLLSSISYSHPTALCPIPAQDRTFPLPSKPLNHSLIDLFFT